MFCNRKRKNRKGFILIYVMFIVTLCIFIALNCFKLEVLKRENNLNMEKSILKVGETQKIKEYMLTGLDEFLYKNIPDLTSEGIKTYLNSSVYPIVKYEDSYVEYNKEKNCFVLVYYVKHMFYEEELYEYNIKNRYIYYNCVDHYFNKAYERK